VITAVQSDFGSSLLSTENDLAVKLIPLLPDFNSCRILGITRFVSPIELSMEINHEIKDYTGSGEPCND
jgi:hypothetical protein